MEPHYKHCCWQDGFHLDGSQVEKGGKKKNHTAVAVAPAIQQRESTDQFLLLVLHCWVQL